MADKKIEIYYDGSCPMCTAFADGVSKSEEGGKFEQKDITKGALPQGATFNQVWKEMYVVDASGREYVGGNAWLRVLEEYPHLRWLARLGRLPFINQCVRIGYRIVAKYRHWIPWKKLVK